MAEFIPPYEEPEESDTVLASTERTKPRFPTTHGVDGRPWREIFKDAKKVGPEVAEDEPEPEVQIIEAAHDLQQPLSAPGAAGTLARRLSTGGWTVRVLRSVAAVPPVLYKNNSADGEHFAGDILYAAYEMTAHTVIGIKRAGGRMMAVEACWTSKDGFLSAVTHDPVLGRERRTSIKAPRKPYAWEKEEGIDGPMGLEQWLALTCPKPEKKTKKEERNAYETTAYVA